MQRQRPGLLILLLLVSWCRGDIMLDTGRHHESYETLVQERSVQIRYIITLYIVRMTQYMSICQRWRSAHLHNTQIWSLPAMSQAERDVTERKEEDIVLCHPHYVSLNLVCAGPPPRTTLCWCTLSPRCSPTLPSTTSRARSSCPPSPTPGHSEECNQYISFK